MMAIGLTLVFMGHLLLYFNQILTLYKVNISSLSLLGLGSPTSEIKPKPVHGMGHGVKVSDLKREDAPKVEPTVTSTAPATHANTTTNTTTTDGSTKVLGLGGSSAFQPIHKAKDSLPKENGEKEKEHLE